jgi:hypothetical protein
MKPTEEIIINLNIERYMDWIRDIYKNLPLCKYASVHEGNISVLKYQEFRITSYYRLKWQSQRKRGEITDNEIIIKSKRLEKAFTDRARMKVGKECLNKIKSASEYIFKVIPTDRTKNKNGKSLLLSVLNELTEINIGVIYYYDQYISDLYDDVMRMINDKMEINEAYTKHKINEYLGKDFKVLEAIVNKRFTPIYGECKQPDLLNDNVGYLDEIAELKVLQTLLTDNPKNNPKGLSLTAKIELLNQLGFFQLKYFEYPCPKSKIDEITAILIDGDMTNTRQSIKGITTAKPKTGYNPGIHKDRIKQLLKYIE